MTETENSLQKEVLEKEAEQIYNFIILVCKSILWISFFSFVLIIVIEVFKVIL